ncbi:MAG: hypothetical protein HZB48_04805 [Actinobacteria bacterium]|uniref:hypothetical protein n=1 Tax=Propionicimonas sp. T2.31MG-18 TaxID=3157620 RepID=UPI0035E747F4|nr:hypothetical protein [Actinomycetota bacterium]
MNGVVAVDELTRAYRAATLGEFRGGGRRAGRSAEVDAEWRPTEDERTVAVVGCLGGAGASTVALGLASATDDARVVECCTVAASGLAGASSAELGSTPNGWVQGSRGSVLLERRGERIEGPGHCPIPSPTTRSLTVLDCGWDVDLLVGEVGWLGAVVREAPAVVAVTRPTLPGMRRLDAAVGLLGLDRVCAVVVGVERRWPRPVEQALGPSGRALRAEGRLIGLPHYSTLAMEGLTPEPLPAPVLAGCSALLTLMEGNLR